MNNQLVISDVHLNIKHSIYIRNILFNYLIELSNHINYDEVVFLGDIFDNDTLNNVVISLFKELILLFKNNVNIKIMVGNHDEINNNKSVYDLMLLHDNIEIISNIKFDKNRIYIPYVKRGLNSIFTDITEYINKNKYEEYYIYSHNDFSELYSFKSKFSSLEDLMTNIDNNTIYFINGHNHIPKFTKLQNNIYLLNIGSSINLNFKDGFDSNVFLYINENKLEFYINENNLRFYVFDIHKETDIEYYLSLLDVSKFNFVLFKIYNINISLSSDLLDTLYDKYNILEYEIDYNFQIANLDNVDTTNSATNIDIKYITEYLNLSYKDFNEVNYEKIEVLLYLLNSFFIDEKYSEDEKEKVINLINDIYINDKIEKIKEVIDNTNSEMLINEI